jgi:hypothetical protein
MILTAQDASTLAATLECWERAEYVACALVTVGCIGEFIGEFTDLCTGGVQERKDQLKKLSTLLLISALAFELVCLYKTNHISGLLIGSLSDKATTAETKAQSAMDKSSLAENQASAAQLKTDALSTQADALTARMAIASGKLGGLEHDIFVQSPRRGLLLRVAPELKKQLALFPGQRAVLFVCGRLGSQDGETLATWGAIADILGSDGAKWKLEHGGLSYFDRCSPGGGQPLGQGLMVFVSKRASQTTLEAAQALSQGLAKALPPSRDKMPGIVDPDFYQKFIEPIEGKDTPWAMVANDPDLVTVLIGAHPQQ